MAAFDLPRLAVIGEGEITRFRRDGFLVVERILDDDAIEALRGRFPKLFAGQFDTGVYPNEWYWREGMSLPDVTRHMANAWKADLSVARLVLSEAVGRAPRVSQAGRAHGSGKTPSGGKRRRRSPSPTTGTRHSPISSSRRKW